MTREPQPLDSRSILRASEIVRRGGLIVYPTDTVYGLGCDPFNEDAVRRLFEVKGRGPKPVPVLCSSASKAEELVILSRKALGLARANWPGALTIVAPTRRRVPLQLTQGSGNLGVRVPSHSAALALIELCGGWLTGTSANISGQPSSRTAGEALRQVGDLVDMVLDGGVRNGKESTVVQVVGDTVTILRTGPVGVGDEVKGGRIS
jgi:L-threonylcarbamoyladenylate synthase